MHRAGGRGVHALRIMLRMWILWLSVTLLNACQPSAPEVDHLAEARTLAAEITVKYRDAELSHPEYEQVATELQLISRSSPQWAEAEPWLKQIQDARRNKLWTVPEQEGGSFPAKKARSRSGMAKASPANRSATPPGWQPYDVTIDMDAINASVKAGSSSTAASTSSASKSGSGRKAKKASSGVTIYTTAWCGVCKAAKAYMNSKGIAYVERNIEQDASARAEHAAKTGGSSSVPVIDVNGELMVGFEESALDRMLKKNL